MMNTLVLERKLSITIQLNSREEFEGEGLPSMARVRIWTWVT